MFTRHVKDASAQPGYAYPMETMGKRIRTLREAKGLTQIELAKICGISREALSQWESDTTENPKLEPLIRLYHALGTTPEYLLWGPDAPALPPEVAGRRPR